MSGEGASRTQVGTPTTAQLTLREEGGRVLSRQPVAAVLPRVTVHWLVGAVGQTVDEAATQATGLTVVVVGAARAAAADACAASEQAELHYTWPAGTAPGPRRLCVLIDGVDVIGSPFNVEIFAPEKVRFIAFMLLLLLLLVFFFYHSYFYNNNN